MMLRLLSLLILVACASAFTSPQPWGARTATRVNMFSADDDDKAAKPLETVDPLQTTTEEAVAEKPTGSVVKNMNTGETQEVKWVDPAMAANTNPLEMNWWAYIAFGFPFVLLGNDVVKSVFHMSFIPTDGPLGFFGRL